jgi:hypothetical protein
MRALIGLLALVAVASPALASSDDAWAEFRKDVEETCADLVQDPGKVSVKVNPFWSESYGAAIVEVKTDAGTDSMICIYDKTSHKAELTSPF